MIDTKNITILCKVVDNFGDIGFVYRLARALTERDGQLRLRLIVSDL
ncbi:MAG: elongation factor P maturation arginine rhamnosyltransferase EarP, partial [Treponemataceae bacterium]|nr:elongation factor P maturation arginine rhamnosyltransferase EarP [Treponemataceae bacterium]